MARRASPRRVAWATALKKARAAALRRLNCHILLTMRYQETSENTDRTTRTTFVSVLEVAMSSHVDVGTARPDCSIIRRPPRSTRRCGADPRAGPLLASSPAPAAP